MEENPYRSPRPYAPEPLPPPPGDFRDQSVGLTIFGGIQVVVGGFLALSTLVTVGMAVTMAVGGRGASFQWQQMAGNALMSGVLAVGLIWLGVGTILARRWAWALNLVGAWLSLIVGTITSGVLVLKLPTMIAAVSKSQFFFPIAMVAGGVVLGLYIGMPLAFVLFYRRPAVRATCEWRDPHVRWTERCPLPVLAVSVVLAYGLLTVSGYAALGCVVPLFGQWVSGPLGGLILLIVAMAMGYLAWGAYRLRPAAWWGTLALVIVVGISSLATFARTDLLEMYRQMGMPAEQVALVEKAGMSGWWSHGGPQMLYLAAMVAYLFYVRRYFFPSEAVSETPPQVDV